MSRDGATVEGDGGRAKPTAIERMACKIGVRDDSPKELEIAFRFRGALEANARALWGGITRRAKSPKPLTRAVYTLLELVLLMIWTVLFGLSLLLSGGIYDSIEHGRRDPPAGEE